MQKTYTSIIFLILIAFMSSCSPFQEPLIVYPTYTQKMATIYDITFSPSQSVTVFWYNKEIPSENIQQFEIQYKTTTAASFDNLIFSLSNTTIISPNYYAYTIPPLNQGYAQYEFKIRSLDYDGFPSYFSAIYTKTYVGPLSYLNQITYFSTDIGTSTFLNPAGLAINSSGQIFVADKFQHCIFQFNTNYQWEATFGTPGIAQNDLEHFSYPCALVFDAQDNLYVADSGNNRIVRFHPQDFPNSVQKWQAEIPTSSNQIDFHPVGLTYHNPSKSLYCSDKTNKRIIKLSFDDSNTFIAAETYLDLTNLSPTVTGISGLTSDENHLYILTNYDILKYALASASLLLRWGQNPSSLDQNLWQGDLNSTNALQGISLDNTNQKLYVTDTFHHQIFIFSPSGNYLANWGQNGTAIGQFQSPQSLFFHQQKLYISDNETSSTRLQIFQE
jgi:sugar lactone lactonase YvrE